MVRSKDIKGLMHFVGRLTFPAKDFRGHETGIF